MGWETRSNGSFYYKKNRIGNRVFSEYVGSGEVAECIAQLDYLEQLENSRKRNQITELRQQFDEMENHIQSLSDLNKNLVDALFLINGFRQHKRQWRKKHNASANKN